MSEGEVGLLRCKTFSIKPARKRGKEEGKIDLLGFKAFQLALHHEIFII